MRRGGASRSPPEIDFDDARMVLHVLDRAFGQHRTLVQYRDLGREAAHEGHVVLDDDDRAVLRQAADQLGGRLGLAVGHAGDRLVEQQELAVVDQQHADLEPLLLAVAQRAGRLLTLLGQPDALQGSPDALAPLLGQAGKQRPPGAAAVGEGEFEVIENGQVFENGRPLKLAPDAEIGDRRLVEPGQIGVAAKEHLARIRTRLAGDDIHHRRLAGAVGADDRAQLALLDDERELVQRLEPVKADGHAVDVEEDVAHASSLAAPGSPTSSGGAAARRRLKLSWRKIPTMPRGKTSVVRMNSPPRMNSQISGAALVSQVFARLTSPAPRMAPASVPRPPTETQIAISIELPGENSLGLMMPTCGTYSAPAMPANTADTVKTNSFARVV